MVKCVYPHCGGTLEVRRSDGCSDGYCNVCKQPARQCSVCQTWNRSLAAWCRKCGSGLAAADPSTAPVGAEIFAREPVRVRLDEPCWSPPQTSGGCLWTVGQSGQLYRINPFAALAERQHAFGDGTGYGSFLIREMERQTDPSMTEPFAIAVAPDRVTAWGLVSRFEYVFNKLEPGEQILAECIDRCQFMEANRSTVWCLTQRDSALFLLTIALRSGNAVRTPLEPGIEAGPVLLGDSIVVWSRQTLAIGSANGWETIPFAEGFEAWTKPPVAAGLILPIGQSALMKTARSVYVFGEQGGTPAVLRLEGRANAWMQSLIPIPIPATGAQDASGRPLLSLEGRLAVCEQASIEDVCSDPEIIPHRGAYSQDALCAYFCQSSGSEHLRLQFSGDARRQTIAMPADFEAGGFWQTGSAFAARVWPLNAGQRQTEFLIWHS